MKTYRVIKQFSEYNNIHPIGGLVYQFTGPTYGCITPMGEAVSLTPKGTFFEAPKDCLEEVKILGIKEYELLDKRLTELDVKLLDALKAAGVDNWEGYSEAFKEQE